MPRIYANMFMCYVYVDCLYRVVLAQVQQWFWLKYNINHDPLSQRAMVLVVGGASCRSEFLEYHLLLTIEVCGAGGERGLAGGRVRGARKARDTDSP